MTERMNNFLKPAIEAIFKHLKHFENFLNDKDVLPSITFRIGKLIIKFLDYFSLFIQIPTPEMYMIRLSLFFRRIFERVKC